jgi:hypothetical protein
VTLPVNPDGSVRVLFTMINNTEVPALDGQLSVEICRSCKFANEPKDFFKVAGELDTMRNFVFQQIPASGPLQVLTVDIIPPANAPTFEIAVTDRCRTCVVKHTHTIGKIHIRTN